MTAAGRPCRGHAVEGSTLCSSHLRIAGRKTKLTAELAAQLDGLLRNGTPVGVAVAVVGLAKSTYYEWIEQGDAGSDARLVAFKQRMDVARATGQAVLVRRVAAASQGDWRAAAFLLERGWPEQWARPSQRPEPAPEPGPADPFAEFDELAALRAQRGN